MRLRRLYRFALSISLISLIAACGGGAGGGGETGAPGTTARAEGSVGTDSVVPLCRIFERSVTNINSYPNKFTDVNLDVQYTSPSGRQIRLPGFYDGDGRGGQTGDVWKFRFLANDVGTWSYAYSWSDGKPGGTGTFEAVSDGAGPGVLRPYSGNPHWFAHEGDKPAFLKSYYVGAGGQAVSRACRSTGRFPTSTRSS